MNKPTSSSFAASASADPLSLTPVAVTCTSGTCPTVYRTNRGTFVVQGYAVTGEDAGVNLPDGELLVEIPIELLSQAPTFTHSSEVV